MRCDGQRDKDQVREGECFFKLSWQPSWILNHQMRLGNLRPDQKRSQDSFSRFVFPSVCLSASVHYFCCVTAHTSVSLSPTKSPEGNKVHKCRTQSQSASWGGFCLQQFVLFLPTNRYLTNEHVSKLGILDTYEPSELVAVVKMWIACFPKHIWTP